MDTITTTNTGKPTPLDHQLGAYLKTASKFTRYLQKTGVYFRQDQPFTISSGQPCYAQYYLPAMKVSVEVEGNPLQAPSRDKHSDELLLAEQGVLTVRLTKSDIYEGESRQWSIGKILWGRAGYMVLNNDFTAEDMSRHLLLDIGGIMKYVKNFAERQGISVSSFFKPWYSKSIDTVSLTGYHLFSNRAIPIYAINKLIFQGELTCLDEISKAHKIQLSDERIAYTEKVLASQEKIIMDMLPDLPESFIREHNLF